MERIVFNPSKHHLRAMLEEIAEHAQKGEEAADVLLEELGIKGVHRTTYNGIVDVYFGKLTVAQIKSEIVDFLREKNIGTFEVYKNYIEEHGDLKRRGHYLLTELSDKTVITLRIIENEQSFVHAHPGRYSPNTFRVKANTLKTGLFSEFLARCRKCCATDLSLINDARRYLEMSPVNDAAASILDVLEKFASFEVK